MPISLLIWVCSFIEPDLFDNNVPVDSTSPIYVNNLSWKLGLGLLGFRPESECTILAFLMQNKESEHFIFREFCGP